jgi:hypothetical protein
VLLFESEEDCGKNMWELAFVFFWLMVSFFGCAFCMGCCALGAYAALANND